LCMCAFGCFGCCVHAIERFFPSHARTLACCTFASQFDQLLADANGSCLMDPGVGLLACLHWGSGADRYSLRPGALFGVPRAHACLLAC
jgi:hypothetical protein